MLVCFCVKSRCSSVPKTTRALRTGGEVKTGCTNSELHKAVIIYSVLLGNCPKPPASSRKSLTRLPLFFVVSVVFAFLSISLVARAENQTPFTLIGTSEYFCTAAFISIPGIVSIKCRHLREQVLWLQGAAFTSSIK